MGSLALKWFLHVSLLYSLFAKYTYSKQIICKPNFSFLKITHKSRVFYNYNYIMENIISIIYTEHIPVTKSVPFFIWLNSNLSHVLVNNVFASSSNENFVTRGSIVRHFALVICAPLSFWEYTIPIWVTKLQNITDKIKWKYCIIIMIKGNIKELSFHIIPEIWYNRQKLMKALKNKRAILLFKYIWIM